MRNYKHQNLWQGCVGAWCPSVDRSRSTFLTDFSEQRNNGTLTNMDPGSDWVAAGNGVALDFDGTNDYVTLSRAPATTDPLAISCWFRVRDITAYRTLVCIASSSSNTNYILIPLELTIQAGGGTTRVRPTNAVVANQWMHAAAVVNSANSVCYLDSNGTTTATPTLPTINRGTIGAFFAIGLDGYFNGQLDDVRVYNRALTTAEIRTLASRRGIAYETTRHRVARTSRRSSSGVNMLVGCGL
jgi:uncharacterized protein